MIWTLLKGIENKGKANDDNFFFIKRALFIVCLMALGHLLERNGKRERERERERERKRKTMAI